MSKFEYLDDAGKKEICDILCDTANEHFKKEQLENGLWRYEFALKGDGFESYMSEDEIRESARITVDLLEELKRINNDCIDKPAFQQIMDETGGLDDPKRKIINILKTFEKIKTDKIDQTIVQLNELRRIGGTWAILIANPGFKTAVVSVFNVLVDQFDSEDLYIKSAFLILRSIMHMNSYSVGRI